VTTPPVDPAAALTWRPLRRDDFGLLSAWLDDPDVARWWPDPHTPDDLERHYGPTIDRVDPTEVFVVEIDGVASGLIQRYRLTDEPEWRTILGEDLPATGIDLARAAGIDYLLGRPEVRGRGLGTRLIGAFTAAIWAELDGIDMVVVAVQEANRPSWRALERVGYVRVWSGQLHSDDPSDAGLSVVLALRRPR